MRARSTSLSLLGLLCLALLPLLTDAGIAVPPASQAGCCTALDRPPPPITTGDEEFFTQPATSPNVMLLLDSSGSMLDLPQDLPVPGQAGGPASTGPNGGWGTNYGFCSGSYLNSVVPSATPYDNGYTTVDLTDNPPWGFGRCKTAQPTAPANDYEWDQCLFRDSATSYYKIALTGTTQNTAWTATKAMAYPKNPCRAIKDDGTVLLDSSNNPAGPDSIAECQACLNTAGYYIYRPRLSSTNRSANAQAVFTGKFLNAYPPKFLIARKVVKDLVKMDASDPQSTDAIRFGLTIFQNGASQGSGKRMDAVDGGNLLVPLGPSCAQSFPIDRPSFVTTRQTILNAVNSVQADGTASWLRFDSNTPLAETLFNIGQYFSYSGGGSIQPLYQSLFGTQWMLPNAYDSSRDFRETSVGAINATWAQGGTNRSICWECQNSSVIVVTDGQPTQDFALPAYPIPASHTSFNNDFSAWNAAAVSCPGCPAGSTLQKVSYFLNQTDMRREMDNVNGAQNVSTYTISFGISDAPSISMLRRTAELGGGTFSNAKSATELHDALAASIVDVLLRTSSFSSVSANALQTSRTLLVDSYLSRFRPRHSPVWEGHLFATVLFDEFAEGCDSRFASSLQKPVKCGSVANQNPNRNGDESGGKAICDGTWFVDQDCDPIIEDSEGTFRKGTFNADGSVDPSPSAANMFWDAGYTLSYPIYPPDHDLAGQPVPGYRSADEKATSARNILTTIDVNGDGAFTKADGTVAFTADNAAALAPFMSLDQTFCQDLFQKASVCGAAPLPACPAWDSSQQAICARQVIYFVRGWDVLDWDGDHCGGPDDYYNTNGWGVCTSDTQCVGGAGATCQLGTCKNSTCPKGEERDRPNDSRSAVAQDFWKLGDIFHSAPVQVMGPTDKLSCLFGLRNQCVPTIFSHQQAAAHPTPLASYGTLDAYDKYRQDNINRETLVVVGANDGMLHAFNAGDADTGQPRDAEGRYPFTYGDGGETWAYIPADLLPRLKNMLDSHEYMVDGHTMVRDVWVDGGPTGAGAKDGKKQADEFHTVAVIHERGGGSRFTALDITDSKNPKFLWNFPPNCSADSMLTGQTWTDFYPRPPPIGPVRLKVGTTGNANDTRGFEERWVVMLNGGYDPLLVRGRAVFMLDVWSGAKLWSYTNNDFTALRGAQSPAMFPVAAGIGMVDIGPAERADTPTEYDGFFDTASWGDVAGDLFVARMFDPGVLDGNNHVTNWTAARTFEIGRAADDLQRGTNRSPFFNMTANYISEPNRLYTMVGSGNRERLMLDVNTCGLDNLLGCFKNGCTASTDTAAKTYGAAACQKTDTLTGTTSPLFQTPTTSGCTEAAGQCTGGSFNTTFSITCGAKVLGPLSASITCNADGTCTKDTTVSGDIEMTLAAPSCTVTGARSDCMFGVWSYGTAPEKRFQTTSAATAKIEALAFDKNRFTDVKGYSGCGAFGTCSVVDVSPAKASSTGVTCDPASGLATCWATAKDPGWKLCYGQYDQTGHDSPPWCNERTATGATGLFNCVTWSTFRPSGGETSPDPCTSTSFKPTATAYLADFVSGVPTFTCQVGTDESTYTRAYTRNVYSAPHEASRRVVVSPSGAVQYSAIIDDDGTQKKHTFGERTNVSESLYWLEVPKASHTCRHVASSGTCQ